MVAIPARVLFVLLTFFLSAPLTAQDSTALKYYKITFIDDSELTGTIISQDSLTVQFLTMAKLDLTIKRTQIKKIEDISAMIIKDVYFPEDPNNTRLLFAPTAKPLKAGKGYFALYELFFSFIGYGIGDVFTIAGGMSLIPGVGSQIVYFAPKATFINSPDFSAAAGVIHFTSTMGSSEGGIGIGYGVATYSGERASFSAGLGWGYAGEDFTSKPIIMGAAELRASRYAKVIVETWFPPDVNVGVGGVGVRFFGTNFATDLAFLYMIGEDAENFPLIPWVSVVYNF
ncbi:MAG: hypothetical protein HUU54_06770 [Ignavibacteriaceae bacterium]|nr:hypothetical protein [Ignavibacteriaceae bacterium]